MDEQDKTGLKLEVYLAEYDKVKSEQAQRIGHRDNLVYATLVATASVIAFAFKEGGDPIGLMVLPFACFVLGWLHTTNDEKISAVGEYLRTALKNRISTLTSDKDPCLLGWENAVRAGPHRRWRKMIELLSKLVTFVAPGALAMPVYWHLTEGRSVSLVAATVAGSVLLVVLVCEIVREADVGLSRSSK